MKKLMFISSCGGHLEELLALKSLFNDYEYSLITEKTKTTKYLKDEYKNVSYLVYGTKEHLLSYIFIFPFNIIKSFNLFLKYQPDYVISTGTHTAVPMMMIARLFKKKTIYIETMANISTPTKAGEMLYGKTDLFVVQWENMKKIYPNAEYWGNIF